MFDDICKCLFYAFIVTVLFVWGCYCGYANAKPKEIKDTKCVYYEEQIYCLQESEGK